MKSLKRLLQEMIQEYREIMSADVQRVEKENNVDFLIDRMEPIIRKASDGINREPYLRQGATTLEEPYKLEIIEEVKSMWGNVCNFLIHRNGKMVLKGFIDRKSAEAMTIELNEVWKRGFEDCSHRLMNEV